MREDDVRELMQKAAATIHTELVPADQLLVTPAPMSSARSWQADRRWLVPGGVVAAVLLIVIGSIALGSRGGDEGNDQTAVSPSAGATEDRDPPTSDDPDQTAGAFVAFASGEKSAVPWADEVTYYVGGQKAAVLDADGAARPDSWEGCAEGGTYAGRDCPVSALGPVADLVDAGDEPSLESVSPKTVGCSRGAAPDGIESAAVVSIRPPTRMRDCFSDFAVSLYLDDDGRVSAVNLQLSSP
jgi:hypothetical protein